MSSFAETCVPSTSILVPHSKQNVLPTGLLFLHFGQMTSFFGAGEAARTGVTGAAGAGIAGAAGVGVAGAAGVGVALGFRTSAGGVAPDNLSPQSKQNIESEGFEAPHLGHLPAGDSAGIGGACGGAAVSGSGAGALTSGISASASMGEVAFLDPSFALAISSCCCFSRARF